MSLPSGYTRLEYIKSSGTQYINTGFNPNQNTRVVVDAKPLSVTQAQLWCIFGVRTSVFFELYKASTRNMRLTFLYGSTYTQGFDSLDYTKRQTFEINKNTATVDGTTLTYSAQTFQQAYPLFLFASDNTGTAEGIAAAELYSAKVYDNGTLIRDFIPCKNTSGVIGLWDDVNSVFYQNAGSGTFDAGELPKAHKVCINGIGYSATKATMLIDGTERKAKKGRVLIDGTGYDLKFVAGIPLSDLSPGTILTINENGTPVQFYVAKHDYESDLNGAGRTLVVRKDCYDMRQWHSSDINIYASSTIDSWLNVTYKNLLDANIRGVIGTTKIKYTIGGDNHTVGTLERAIFLLSATELNRSESWFNVEGTALEIASSLQIAYMNGSAVSQWTRSPSTYYYYYTVYLFSNGVVSNYYCTSTYGSRPAFTLPSDAEVQNNGDGTYHLAE